MPDYGIMLYGYNAEDADKIKSLLEAGLGVDIDLISASTMEDSTVIEILDKGDEDTFEDKETKLLMYLGDFTDEQLRTGMKAIPKDAEPKRPIFCTLTENNLNWKLTQLIEDLLEEEKYWQEQGTDS